MKKFRRVLLAAVFAVILALGAVCLTACNGKGNGGDNNSKPQYKLTFMVGTVPWEEVVAEEGSAYTLTKGNPTRPNNVFDGWSRTANGEVEQLPDKMPSGNRTYYAIFSARYNLNFNAGIGSIPDDKKTVVVKEGDDLYELVKDVTPTVSDGDAAFNGWYLRGTSEITATSGQKMPKNNVEVVAKYLVNYTINIYKEIGFDSGDYADDPDDVVNKTAYVGDKVAGLPTYSGYYYDESKDNDILYANLNKNSAQNAFELYYKLIGYDTVFNANLPSEVTYTGAMDTMTCGYGIEYDAPECQFEADGYRFYGWSTTPDGEVEYREGEKFSVERSTTMYAQWVKGMTELAGRSSDRVYLFNKKEGGVIPYLERTGLDDIAGEYNPTTHIFTFKNENATNPDAVLLRGIVDSAHNTFTYLNTHNTTVYKLQNIDETVNASVTLTLSDNGDAVYFDGTDTVNGRYVGANDGSMLFTVDGEHEFSFRLVHSADGFVNFMIRGDEYGTWNNITQAGVVDLSYTLEFDGYGYAVMYVSGLNSSLSGRVTSTFNGRYYYNVGEGAYLGNEGTEVIVRLYNSSLQMRQFACLLMTGSYHTVSADDTTVYTNVYLQRFETTLYGAPADDDELDTETADKIELAGYSVMEDSATYTYTGGDGEPVTVKGKYSYDSTAGTLRIMRADGGADLLFEVSMYGEGDDMVPVFESVEELFGQYAVLGLDNVFGPNIMYTLHIYNNNRAAFAFRMPRYDDSFYGNIVYEYTRMIFGEYSVAVEGTNEMGGSDPRANVYEFSAEIDPYIANYIYYMYGSIFQYPLYVSTFGSFRFQFVYSATTQRISYVNVTIVGDHQAGYKLAYNDVEYTLDGFGTAESENGNLQYSYNTSIGIARLFLVPDEQKPKDTVLFIDWKGDGTFVEYDKSYSSANSNISFFMLFFKDNTALLTLSGSSTLDAFAFGHVTWDDEEHTSGKYERDDSIHFSDEYLTVNKMIKDFKFIIRTSTVKDKNGEDQTTTRVYVYDVNSAANADNEIVIVNADGDELTLKPMGVAKTEDGLGDTVNIPSAAATYIKKGAEGANDTEYNGTFQWIGDKVQFIYTVAESNRAFTFKLEYNNDGAITGFHVVGSEEGYSLSADDGKSYLYLSGEEIEEKGVYGGVYYKYDADSESYTEYSGTYCWTSNNNATFDRMFGVGYDFTYETGEEDEDGNKVKETFTFGIASTQLGVTYFKKFVMQVEQTVLYMSASIGRPAAIGALSGGGYEAQVFTLYPNTVYQTQYEGELAWSSEWLVWVFTATNGSTFYFRVLSGVGVFLLDNTYVAEAKGTFELSQTVDVEVPEVEGQDATEDTEAVPAVPAHTAHATKIEMSGMAFAYLHYDYTNDNGETEDRTVTGIYVQYATNGFAFILVGSEDTTALFRFRLNALTDEESGEVTYVAELADMDYYGTFVGEDLTVINLNGFDYAYYVDSYGRVYGGGFEILDDSDKTSVLIHIQYIDTTEFVVKNAYARLDLENHTFVTVAAPATDAQA